MVLLSENEIVEKLLNEDDGMILGKQSPNGTEELA